MQSVSRGTARRRGSQDTLLARSIAVSRKSSGRVPALTQARRLITRSPRSVRLGQIGQHARGKWLVLCALFFGSAVVYGAVIGGETARAYDAVTGGRDRFPIPAGFGLNNVNLHGPRRAVRGLGVVGGRAWLGAGNARGD